MSSTTWKILVILLIATGLRMISANVIDDAQVSWDYKYEEIAYNLAERGEYAYSFYGLSESRPPLHSIKVPFGSTSHCDESLFLERCTDNTIIQSLLIFQQVRDGFSRWSFLPIAGKVAVEPAQQNTGHSLQLTGYRI